MKVIPFFIIFVETINIMKNIHILPTDQPSRLVKIKDTFFITSSVDISGGTFYNIYITSDEEIKEGDYVLSGTNTMIKCLYPNNVVDRDVKKIILTTDQDLIADGVQAIDDEFLKWFVKNPTCEFVKVVDFPWIYKITIPQEEPKQDLEKEMFQLEQELDIPSSMRWHNSKPKQVKYTEDEVRELLIKGLTHNDDKLCGSLVTVQKEIRTANFNVWFEENKKK